jgi:peptidoglycan/LPS O-acetylase OafA/YrhL
MCQVQDVPRLGHRPALDGVRGIAILLVVSYHLAGWPRGGNLGVDVFFVLSGFLITTLLLEEQALAGAIGLRAFYERRARRLLPALFFMLTIAAVISAGSFTARQMVVVYGSATFYASNFVRAFTHPDQILGGPTGHLWSLAEEEQFYLLWPIILIFLLRRRIDLTKVLGCAFVALVVYRLALIASGVSIDRVKYSPDTHAEGLVLGCLLAVLWRRGLQLPRWAGWLGLAAVAALAVFSSDGSTFGLPAAEIATAALIGCALQTGFVQRGLSFPPLVYLGVISYSLYVWHQFANWVTLWHHQALAFALTVPLTLGSYYLIERPFRRRRARPPELELATA